MSKKYTSFDQIDSDLKILKIKKDIDWLCVKSDYERILRNLSLRHLFSDVYSEVKESFLSKRSSLIWLGAQFIAKKFFSK